MNDNLLEIDTAMNMIKDEMIRELSECVAKQNKKSNNLETSSNKLSFSVKRMD